MGAEVNRPAKIDLAAEVRESAIVMRRSTRYQSGGKKISLRDLCGELGVKASIARQRLYRGDSLYHALFGMPKRQRTHNPSAEARRVADHMEQAGAPISIGDACEAVGVDRQHAGYTLTRLRAILGQRLVFHSKSEAKAKDGRPEAFYVIVPIPDQRKVPRRVYGPRTVPADLWRGWINPATGIIPPRLGVDLPQRATTTQA